MQKKISRSTHHVIPWDSRVLIDASFVYILESFLNCFIHTAHGFLLNLEEMHLLCLGMELQVARVSKDRTTSNRQEQRGKMTNIKSKVLLLPEILVLII